MAQNRILDPRDELPSIEDDGPSLPLDDLVPIKRTTSRASYFAVTTPDPAYAIALAVKSSTDPFANSNTDVGGL